MSLLPNWLRTCLVAIGLSGLIAAGAAAHCDTMDGPVVIDARTALDSRDITPVLKWVGPAAEAELTEDFSKTLAVREMGPQARELADYYFFETLVRLHRAGEGASYTGLKPAGSELEPAVIEADHAIESGSVEKLVTYLTDKIAAELKEKFEHLMETRRHMAESVELGRKYVAAYVDFVHFAERLATAAAASHSESAPETEPKHNH